LSARILEQEHQLYPEAVAQVLTRNQYTQAANS
jgi:folate-dependent phosphoribosylglycinamide formyltransferase PurN